MDFEFIFSLILAKAPGAVYILMLLGALCVLAQAFVIITPSKSDDAAWEKIKSIPFVGGLISALVARAPIQKK